MRDEVSGHEPADFGDAYRFWRRESNIDTARVYKILCRKRRYILIILLLI